jgi:hypothetical protein
MSIVEKLAKSRIPHAAYGDGRSWDDEMDMICAIEEARWWLNAIADEIEVSLPPDEMCGCIQGGHAARWLREQAGQPNLVVQPTKQENTGAPRA